MSRSLFIYGGGGHARVIISTARAAGVNVRGIFDDDAQKAGSTIDGCPVLGAFDMDMPEESELILAIGSNDVRKQISERLDERVRWATLVHPSAILDTTVEVGEGSVVFAGVIVQPGTSIGRHVILNTASTVDNDCRVGDHVHVAPGVHVAGHVEIGDGALLGIGASVVPGVKIGEWSTIGAGAGVTRRVSANRTVVGVPARDLYTRK